MGLVPSQHDDHHDKGLSLGFMEFFDWLAGTSNEELLTIAKSFEIKPDIHFGRLAPRARYKLALEVWSHM